MDLGSAIKTLRKKKGLSQENFAKISGITQTYLSQIENNLKEPNISKLKIISSKLEVPLPILFFLSLNEDDIKPEKKESFKVLIPSVKSLVNECFKV